MTHRRASLCRRAKTHLVLALFTSLAAFAQQPEVLAPHRPVAPRVAKQPPLATSPITQVLSGAWWNVNQDFKSAIYLTNNLKTNSLTVTPKLYLSSGTSYTLAPVKLDPEGTAIVDLGKALADRNIASNATLSGYVEVDYSWPWAALCAIVRSVDVTHSVIFTSTLQPLAVPAANLQGSPQNFHSFEGMWWKQEKNVTAFLALSNLTGNPINAQVSVDGDGMAAGQHNLIISPHATRTLDLTELPTQEGAAGGIRVTYDGPAGGLSVNGGLEDMASGYSANLPVMALPEPAPGSSTTFTKIDYAQLGLMNGTADSTMRFPAGTTFAPYSVSRNVSSQPVTVTPQLWWMEGQVPKSAQLLSFTVAPHQTKVLDTASLLAGAGLHEFNGTFNLVLHTSGPTGALMVAGGSVDKQNTYVFAVSTHGVSESVAKTLSYWSTGNGDDTMVTIWNPADETQDFAFTLYFTGGHYILPVQLGPRASEMLNISELIKNQIPDAEGNTIPVGTHDGSAEIAGSLGENQLIMVGIDAGIYNAQKATCFQGCNSCQGVVSTSISYAVDPSQLPVGSSDQLTFFELYSSGFQYDFTTSSQWSSSNTGVATVSGGLIQSVAAGTATITTIDNTLEYPYVQICNNYFPGCPISSFYPSQSLSVSGVPPVWLQTTYCNSQNSNGTVPYVAGWAKPDGSCLLSATVGLFTPSIDKGSCIQIGTTHYGYPKWCWQTNTNNCVVTTCASEPRYENSGCTAFVDNGVGFTTVKVPAGCTP